MWYLQRNKLFPMELMVGFLYDDDEDGVKGAKIILWL